MQLVDVCSPGDTHAEIAIAALDAGKHVLCEKPLANAVDEARAMVAAAERAAGRGVRSMVGLQLPPGAGGGAVAAAAEQGRIGEIRHVRAQYLQDWIVDPEFPLVWRLQRSAAGSGALGDIGAHIVDMAQYVVGDRLTGVRALTETFVRERPLPARTGRASSGLSASAVPSAAPVAVDDAALFLGRFGGGGGGGFEATRFATGRKNAIRLEVNGSAGSLAFDFESMNELVVLRRRRTRWDPETAGFRRILVTEPTHPYAGAWWPPGHLLGYEHSFTHEVVDLITATWPRTATRPRRSPTACRCSWCWTRSAARPRRAAAGSPSIGDRRGDRS